MEVATWNGPNINRTSNEARACAARRRARFEKGLQPEQAHARPRPSPRKLMIELTRRDAASAARSTSAAPEPRPAADPPARARASQRCWASRSRASASAEMLHALGFDSAPTPRRPRRHRAAAARAQRRHPRGRPDRGGRAPRRPRQAARDAARAPRRRRAADARPARCAAAPRTRSSAAACTRSSAGASPSRASLDRLRLPADDDRCAASCALENPMSEDHVDPAHRRARLAAGRRPAQHRARRGATCRCSSQGAVYFRAADPPTRALPHEHRALGALLTGRARAAHLGRAVAAAGRLLRGQGPARRRARRAARRLVGRAAGAASRSCIPAAARGSSPASEIVGWVGELHPLVARDVGSGGAPSAPSRSTSAASPPHAVAVAAYRDLTSFPPVRQDLAVVVADDVAARDGARRGPRAPADALLRDVADLRRLPGRAGRRGAQVARAGARRSRPPTAR